LAHANGAKTGIFASLDTSGDFPHGMTNIDINDFPGARVEKDWEWWSNFLQREYYSGPGERRGWDAAAADVAAAVELSPGMRVLDLGCGAGEMLYRLAMRGADVVGVEHSASLVDHCRRRAAELGVAAEFVAADMFEWSPNGTFDVVLSLNTSFGYGTDEQNRALVRRIAEWLAPRGVFYLDVATADAAEAFGQWGDDLAGGTFFVDNVYEESMMISAPYWVSPDGETLYYASEPERVRLYERSEIERMMLDAGLEPERLRRAMGRRFDQDDTQMLTTWRSRRVARRA
jgi:SAM-dependent methyltransferase